MQDLDLGLGILIGIEDAFSSKARMIGQNAKKLQENAEGAVGGFEKLNKAMQGIAGAAIFQKAKSALNSMIAPAVAFDETMARVRSRMTDNSIGLEGMTSEIVAMSNRTGKGVTELGESMTNVLGSGVGNAKESIDVLNQAVRLAQANFTTTTATTNTLTNAMLAFKIPARDVAEAANAIQVGANAGNLGMEDLNTGIMQAGATVSSVGGTFNEFIGMISTLASQGVTGRKALGTMNIAMGTLLNNQKDLDKLAKKGGFKDLRDLIAQKGMVGALDATIRAAKGNEKTLQKLGLSATDVNQLMFLLGDNLKNVAKQTESLSGSTAQLDKDWTTATGNAKDSWDKFKNSVSNAKLTVGMALLQTIKPFLPLLEEMSEKLTKLIKENPEFARTVGFVVLGVAALGVVFGGLVTVLGFVGVIGAKVIAVAGLLAVGITWLIGVTYAASKAGQWLGQKLIDLTSFVWDFHVNLLKAAREGLPALGQAFKAGFDIAVDAIKNAILWLDNMRAKLAELVKSIPIVGNALAMATGLENPFAPPPTTATAGGTVPAPTGAWAGATQRVRSNTDLSASGQAAPIAAPATTQVNVTVPQSKIEPADIKLDGKLIGQAVFNIMQTNTIRATG